MNWKPISEMPEEFYDGRDVRVRVLRRGKGFTVNWYDGFMDKSGANCGMWIANEGEKCPKCWTDAACWESNEDCVPSKKPVEYAVD